MSIDRLTLHDFSVFRDVDLTFAKGINVFLGRNATGKTHVMKALYATLRAAGDKKSPSDLDARLREKLARVFQPDDLSIGRLGHRRQGQRSARVAVTSGKRVIDYSIYSKTSSVTKVEQTWTSVPSAVFLPSREALAMYEGFIAAYQARELSFDETYFDLAVALGGSALRGTKPAAIDAILRRMEGVLGGSVVLAGPRFYLRGEGGTMLEAHLVSEGMRKIAAVVRLLGNGALKETGVLFWDEPEANLNPHLAVQVAETLGELAATGIQIFVTTHDYLVSETLGRLAEKAGAPSMRFFSFQRSEDESHVTVEQTSALDELEHNPIREEFLRHYDRVRGVAE